MNKISKTSIRFYAFLAIIGICFFACAAIATSLSGNTETAILSGNNTEDADEPYIETYLAENAVDVASGALHMEFSDMSIPGYMPELAVKRLYSSQSINWRFNFESTANRCYYNGDGTHKYQAVLPNGSAVTFYYMTSIYGDTVSAGLPENCFTVKIGSDGAVHITFKDGFTYVYVKSSTMTTMYLKKIVDLNGNSLSIEYASNFASVTGLVDYKGIHYTIEKANGYYVSVTNDTTGQQMIYQYNDDKITVLSSENITYYYTDGKNGKLLKIADMSGATIKEFSYYPYEELRTGITNTITYISDMSNCIKSITDETGMVTTYSYETKPVDMLWYHSGNQTYYSGQITVINKTIETKTDASGNSITNTYDLEFDIGSSKPYFNMTDVYPYYIYNRRIVSTTDSGMLNTEREYYSDNTTVKSIKDRFNNTTQFAEIDELGHSLKTVNPDGSYTLCDYDSRGNLIFEQDEEGNVVIYIHTYDGYYLTKTEKVQVIDNSIWQMDENSNMRPVKNELGQPVITDFAKSKCMVTISEYTTDGIRGLLKKVTSPEGIVTEYEYNDFGQLSEVLNIDSINNPGNLKTSYAYKIIYKDTGTGIIREVAYGTSKNDNEIFYGSKIIETSPNGYITERWFNAQGLETETAKYGNTENKSISKTVYNSMGNKIREIKPNQYDSYDDTSPSENAFCYQYKGTSSLVEKSSDPEGNVTEYKYENPFAKKSYEKTPSGAIYRYEYDKSGELQKKYYSESESDSEILIEEYVANADGNTTELRDTQDKLRADSLTNEFSIADGSKMVRTHRRYFALNADGTVNISEYIETKYVFDYKGRLVKTLNPDGTTEKKVYNENGTVFSEENAGGYITYYEYNCMGQVTDKWEMIEKSEEIRFAYAKYIYDSDGRLINEILKTDYVSYPQKPDITSVTGLTSDEYFVKTISYYDNGKEKSTATSDGALSEFYYDCDGNLIKTEEKVNDIESNITEYSYTENNRPEKPDSKKILVYKKDLYGYSDTQEGLVYLITKFVYDKNGNLTEEIQEAYSQDGIGFTEIKKEYSYDKLDRQITVSVPGLDENGNTVSIKTEKSYDYMDNIIWETDANNYGKADPLKKLYEYNGRGFLTKIIHQGKDDVKTLLFEYDIAGRKTAEVTAENYNSSANSIKQMNRKVYTYDGMDRVVTEGVIYTDSVYDSSSDSWTELEASTVTKAYKYDGNGNVIKSINAEEYAAATGDTVTDKINNAHGMEFAYNGKNLPTMEKTPSAEGAEQQLRSYTYNALGHKTSDILNGETVKTYTYNSSGALLKTVLSDNTTAEENTYNRIGDLVMKKDGNGNETTYEYNALRKIRKSVQNGDDSIETNITVYQYDTSGRERIYSDSTGTVTKTEYSGNDNIIQKIIQKEGEAAIVQSFAYDKNGNLRFETDGNGNVTEYVYDDFDRETEKIIFTTDINAVNHKHSEKKTYNLDDNVLTETKATDTSEFTKSYTYDALGRLTVQKNEYYQTVEILQYDRNSSQKYSYTPVYNSTTGLYEFKKKEFVYNLNNQLIKTIDSLGNVSSQTYDGQGNMDTKSDGNSTLKYEYDILNRLTAVYAKNVEEYIKQSEYTYDRNGNMITQADGRGNITKYVYNAQNKIKSTVYPDEEGITAENYTYYANGLVKTKTDRNDTVTSYTYAVSGNVKTETAGGLSVTYEYDGNGNITSVSDGSGAVTRTYDALNRTTSKTSSGFTISYEYDIITVEGLIAEKSTDFLENTTLTVYDNASRIYKVADESGNTTVYSYYNSGNIKDVTYPNGASEEYTYYDNNLLKSLTNKSNGSICEKYLYTYDSAGNQISKEEIKNGVSKGTTNYAYDYMNRLISTAEPSGRRTQYAYDLSGNRTTETVTENGISTTKSYSYNSQQWLTKTVTDGVFHKEIVSYRHDNNGNLYSKTTEIQGQAGGEFGISLSVLGKDAPENLLTLYEYDAFGRLAKISDDNKIIRHAYDAEGKRISKEVSGKGKIRYIYDSGRAVLELNENNQLLARNIYGINLISRTNDGTTAYYLYNGHGDVTSLTGANGESLAGYSYDAFGNITEETESFDNPYKYAGYEYDDETGLYYCNARYYDPETARFISQDAVTGDPNDPLSLNRYTYCFNNPLKYNDPSGNWPNFLSDMFNGIKNFGQKIVTNISNHVIKPVKNFAQNAYSALNEHIIEPTVNFMQEHKEEIKTGLVGAGLVVGGVAVIAVSGGTAVPAVAATAGMIAGGAMVGAGADITATMLQDYMSDGKFNYTDKQYKAAGIRGAVSGGLMPAGGTGMSLAASSAWSGISFMTGDAASQLYEKKKIDYGQAAMYGMQAGATTYAMGVAMPYIEKAMTKIGGKFKTRNTDANVSAKVTDFYVRPNGDVIPSTGYRYVSSEASYLDELYKSMNIPANSNGTYITFDKYDIASPGRLQVPHDASIRTQFDTLQIIDDIRIPYGMWGTANYLEPIIKNYPDLGIGGATQAITYKSINIDEIVKLKR